MQRGAHRMFLGHLLKQGGSGSDAVGRVVADSYRAPVDEEDARRKIAALAEVIGPFPDLAAWAAGMVALTSSSVWFLQEPARWPALYADATEALRRMGWFEPPTDPADRYVAYRELVHSLGDDPRAALHVLRWWDAGGMVGRGPVPPGHDL